MKDNSNAKQDCFGACNDKKPQEYTREHQKVRSRTTGKMVEISMGPHGASPDGAGGLVPANPFASIAQQGYMHAHPEILGKTGLDEWDSATKGKKLPRKKGK